MSTSIVKSLGEHPLWPVIREVCDQLIQHNFLVYLAGGCVRDMLLGRSPQDFDIATNARPEEVEGVFEKTVSVGKVFGVIVVVHKGLSIEVASFRKDGLYVDGRHPETVDWATPEEDAHRRDFTVNSLFWNVKEEKLIDFVGGQRDLKNKLIRAVGKAACRFSEDKLRMLRALRFSCQLGFEIERETYKELSIQSGSIEQVSKERISKELEKILLSSQSVKGVNLLVESGIMSVIFPGLTMAENEDALAVEYWKKAKLWMLLVGEQCSCELKWVSLFYNQVRYEVAQGGMLPFRVLEADVALGSPLDPPVSSRGQERESQKAIEIQAKNQLMAQWKSLKLSRSVLENLKFYIKGVDDFGRGPLLKDLKTLGSPHGLELLLLVTSDFFLETDRRNRLNELVEEYKLVCTEDGSLPQSFLTGKTLKAMGFSSGPLMGKLLELSYDQQLLRKINSKEEAKKWALSQKK